jgi:outer membrane protein OmpA-like peptidoglycan-associated protein
MRSFAVAGGVLSLGMLLVMCMGTVGCCVSPTPIREQAMVTPPVAPEPRPVAEPVRLPPPAVAVTPVEPPPRVVRTLPPPPPPAPPVMPPRVVKAIEDLSDKYPGLFSLDKEKGLIRFNSDITFDSGSSTVKPAARTALLKLATILSDEGVKDRSMTVIGYTDNVPVKLAATIAHLKALSKSADNQGLSEARAEAVAATLKEGGVLVSRMLTRGRAAAEPVADNATAAGKAKNRRVEIYLTPVKAM